MAMAHEPRLADQVLAHIRERMGSQGSITLTARDVATALGISQVAATYHIRALAKRGEIETRGRGSRGTVVRIGTGKRTQGRGAPRLGGRRTAAFCPWCGGGSHEDWRYCATCGKELPVAGVSANAAQPTPGGSQLRR